MKSNEQRTDEAREVLDLLENPPPVDPFDGDAWLERWLAEGDKPASGDSVRRIVR